jgi:pimeloyl-ACP methyl ester carboxylesterase
MRLLSASVIAALLAGCSSADEPAAPAPSAPAAAEEPPASADDGTAPRFVPGACRFVVPKSADGSAVRCGDVLVPENRAKKDTRTIAIHVAIFPGKKDLPPVFELQGGPGGGSDPMVGYLAAGDPRALEETAFLRERGDYVVFDQRGVGRSEPNLSCAEEMLSATATSSFFGLMKTCRDRHLAAGVDLSAYTTYDNALDVDDIRVALGYAKIDLHAISYGTLLALEVMRQRPQGIRTVVIDGVLPPEAKLLSDTPRTIDENLTRIFTACGAEGACKTAFPDLEASLVALKKSLDEKPFDSQAMGPFDWYQFVGLLGEAMYAPEGVRRIPLWVHDFAARGQAAFDDFERSEAQPPERMDGERNGALAEMDRALDALAMDPLGSQKYLGMNEGMYTSVTCSDSGQYETYDEGVANNAKVRPGFFDPEGLKEELAICAMWPKGEKRATTKQAVVSDIPTLSLGGEFDPVTPSYWAEHVTETLSRSTFLLMRGLAHGSMDPCSRGIKGAFYADPSAKPDASCNEARTLTFATSWQEGQAFRSVKPRTRPVPRPVVRPKPNVLTRPAR